MAASLIFAFLVSAPQPLNLYVEGEGWLRFEREGRAVFAREARLTISEGRLVNEEGLSLLPAIAASTTEGLKADLEGRLILGSGELGRLVLAKFPAGSAMTEVRKMFIAADRPTLGSAGEGSFGVIRVGTRPAPGTQPVRPPVTTTPQQQASQTTPSKTPEPKPAPRTTPAPQTGPLTINVRAENSLSTEAIRLRDIADISGLGSEKAGDILLGTTPALGVPRPITLSLIETRLTASGFARGSWRLSFPDRVVVKRLGREVTHEEFIKTAKEALEKLLPQGSTVEAEGINPSMSCPLGDIQLVALPPRVGRDRTTVEVEVRHEGRRFNARLLSFKVTTPLSGLRIGQEVQVRVKSGGASVMTKGKIRLISPLTGEVMVDMERSVTLTTRLGKDGVLEVTL
jgi:hypothetical protein